MFLSSIPQDNLESIADSWNDTLLIPFYMGACSFLLLLLFRSRKLGYSITSLLHYGTAGDLNIVEEEESRPPANLSTRALETSRLFSCALLSLLCLFATVHIKHSPDPKIQWRSELAHSILYAYICVISVLSDYSGRAEQNQIALHREALLLSSFAVYTYRDLWPFATFHLSPADGSLGWIIWSHIVILAYASIIVPLVVPGVHQPVDPHNPLLPNGEQLSSLLSRSVFSFLDPLIRTALKHVHLPYEELPLLADEDHSEYLRKTSFPVLDPAVRKSQRHIGWAFLRFYARYALDMTIAVLTRCAVGFLSPIAIYQILYYVETDGDGATVKPWFWVLALFLKTLVESVAHHRFLYLVTKLTVQLEGIITELVFEHALKIRMNADVANVLGDSSGSASASAGESTTVSETVSASTVDISHDADGTLSTSTGTLDTASLAPLGELPAPTTPSTVPDRTLTSEGNKKEDSEGLNGGSSLVGKINNLISSDLENIIEMTELPMVIVYTPLKIVISVYFLYRLLGWSVFVGIGLMVIGYIVPGRLGKLLHKLQVERAKKGDERIQTVNEYVGLLRLVKMLGWESQAQARLSERREAELLYIRKIFLLTLVNNQFSWMLPLITLLITYFTFTAVTKKALNASIVFSSLSVLDSLREAIYMMMQYLPMMISGKVSIDRVDDFLRNTELLDAHMANSPYVPAGDRRPEISNETIGFHNAHFTWFTSDTSKSRGVTPSSRNFTLRADGDVYFKRGVLNIVAGPTGAGKTSLLFALLGEMHFIPNKLDAWYWLPRGEGIALCPQEAWLLSGTIKENILFGQELDEIRYKEVLDECALDQDLSLFNAGDSTEVGERGLTLSGGQRARVSLARAVYSKAGIVLLDDVLAALDVHTARWIVDKCLNGPLLAGRTVLLVTHNLAMIGRLAERVVIVSSQGVASVCGTVDDAITHGPLLRPDAAEEDNAIEQKLDDRIEEPKEPVMSASGILIADEDVAFGHVSFTAMLPFFKSMGGYQFWAIYFGAVTFIDLMGMFQIWWLGVWARCYDLFPPNEVHVSYYLGVFTLAVIAVTVAFSLAQVTWISGSIRASRAIHERLSRSILRTTLRFLDKTPVGRILQRFTQDIRSVDGPLSERMQNTFQLTAQLVQRMVIIVIFVPVFLIPGVLLAAVGIAVARLYIKAQLPIKREMRLARAPLFSHFGAAMQGLASIRAYSVQEAFKSESLSKINRYSRVARPYWNLNRWIGLRIDVLGGLFSATLAAYLVLGSMPDASNIGFLLNVSLSLTETFFWWVRMVNSVEVEGNSLERIEQYVNIEHEPGPTLDGKPPASWPSCGRLVVEKLSARYFVEGPDVLHELTFTCEPGEKVGIVGRTGSGKSSLTLSLLRLIPTSGEIFYDGLPTSSLNLDALRSNITIIPQQPELMSGSIRKNLDPFDEYDDAVLNDALRSAGLTNLQEELPEEERISLETSVGSAGSNFSLGQRQVVALARALVRRSKILVLDEATASIDHKTDALVQHSLRTQFKDCTVLTIAHRLHTIMDSDKILVLDTGNLVEFNSPQNLLASSSSVFKTLVDSSKDRDSLYALAGLSWYESI